MKIINFMVLMLASSLCLIQDLKADQMLEVPKEDAEYKYYLGIAESVPTYKDAINQAFEQAVSDAIRDNYGFEASISADTYLTENNSQIMKRFRQNSKKVNLKGFERVDMKVKSDKDKYTIQMLYKYSKKAITLELASLKLGKDAIANENFSEFGGNAKNNLGGIEIITEPAGAFIYLNDEPYLKSPIKVKNQIAPGRYILIIEHPIFESIKEEIIILPNEVTKITKTLVPAFGRLKIETTPSEAEVFIDNKSMGKTPLTNIQMQAGAKFKLRIEHPIAFTQTFENMSVDKNQTRSESFNLKLKPGRLQLIVENKPDAIYIENEKVSPDQRIFERPSGYYTIKALKDGYEDYIESVEIEPETTLTKKISLTKKSVPLPTEEKKYEYSAPFKLEIPQELYFQVSLSIESMGSPIASTKNDTIGGQSDLSFGHSDYLGFFTSITSYVKTDDKTTYGFSPGDISSMKKSTLGVWIYTSVSSYDSDFLQLGFFKEQAKISQYLPFPTGTYLAEAMPGKLVDYTGNGLVIRYCHIGKNSVTFDMRLGIVAYKPVLKNNLQMQNSIYFSMGVGWDMARSIKNRGN